MYSQAFEGDYCGTDRALLLYAFILIKHTIPKENCNLHYLILPSAGHQSQHQKEMTTVQKLFSQD